MDYSWVPSSWEEIQSRRNKEKSISFLKIFMQNLISSVVGAYWDAVNLNSIHIMMSFCVGEIWLLPLYLYWCPAVCRSEGSSKLRTFRNCESESSADPVWWGTHSYVSIPCIVLNFFLNNVQGKRSFSRIFVFIFFQNVSNLLCLYVESDPDWVEGVRRGVNGRSGKFKDNFSQLQASSRHGALLAPNLRFFSPAVFASLATLNTLCSAHSCPLFPFSQYSPLTDTK